ncbi:MAG: prepilin-type N-terminal cleavage/methylation domain-containing protein [Planctomycetes bacterium]|nr:prepilin-type N-terminal cleavage/methylation domain-containing protein [Planctomycetota bacterium]
MNFTLSPIKLSAMATRRKCGFTLLEIVTSLTIMSVLVVAMGSALIVASRGLPDPNSPLAENISSARMIDQIAAELQYAFTVNNASTTGIEFIVERNGSPVTINYSWSGLAGDPLVRQYDGGTPVDLFPSVTDFNLSYDLGAAVFITLPTEGSEIELAKYAPILYSGLDYKIKELNWLGQYFKPILELDAVSWRVTRVVFRAREHGPNDGLTLVQIRTVDDAELPTSTIIEQSVMIEADLGASYTWRQFVFNNVANISPGHGLYLVLQWVQSKNSAVVEYVADPTGFVTTTDGGLNWSFNSDKSLIYYIYGKITMPGEQAYPIRSVQIGLDTGQVDTTRLQTTALLLNQPTKP